MLGSAAGLVEGGFIVVRIVIGSGSSNEEEPDDTIYGATAMGEQLTAFHV